MMFWTSVPLTAMALSGSALLWVVLHPLQRSIRALSVEVSVDSGRAAAKAEECAYAIKLIKSCRTEEYERDRYAALARALAEKQVRLADLRNHRRRIPWRLDVFHAPIGVKLLHVEREGRAESEKRGRSKSPDDGKVKTPLPWEVTQLV